MAHAQLVQYCFINARAERVDDVRRAQAEEELYDAYLEVERMQEEVEKKRARVQEMKRKRELEAHVRLQTSVLGPMYSELGRFLTQYDETAGALMV